MPQFELVMPKMGESIIEATILNWLKKEGDAVSADETVLEIATDKVDSEVPSPVGGTIVKILFSVNDVVPVGKTIALIDTGGAAVAKATTAAPEVKAAPKAEVVITAAKPTEQIIAVSSNGSRFYSPLVLNIARSENISMAELEAVKGSGENGRVTKKDILAYVKTRTDQPAAIAQISAAKSESTPASKSATSGSYPVVVGPRDEIVEMDRMRKLIADHMVYSVHTSPHVSSFVECDVTNVVMWRERMKKEFQKQEGENLTFTPIFIEAVVKAIKDFPAINAQVDGSRLVLKKDINVGMAAALPSGNLIVPVIKNADHLNMTGLAKKVNELTNKARNNKLAPDDIQGGTYTVSNVGTFGNIMGTPIINQPQVAILAVGAIKKKPVVIETAEGDTIGIRHMMYLSHSYDHRVVDGMLGGSFVKRVADYLEQWDVNRGL